MAGHSKWANTKHRKAAQDAKRGKIFTKIIRELVTAAKLGGGDPGSNPRLRAAMDKALSNNMTRDTMDRAIARGVGGDDNANMETIIYEGYGPGGSAKIIRELVTAAKLGGGDPGSNPRLRAAMDKALSNNMTRDTMDRAIARGVGGDDNANMETIIYEGYGPGGSAIMIECLSDNRNRTVGEVRHAFTKTGGNLGTDGSVAYLFNKKGVISYAPGQDEDAVMEAALEAGAEDVVSYDDGAIDVFTAWEEMGSVRDALEAVGLKADTAEVSMIPTTKAEMDAETAPKLLRLIDMLEDCDDVQEVYHNGEISDEVAETL
ncbi:YebC/PmpR family DNA-binding transcriptional regulator [Pantoea sp. M_5]|nr:YebC/PmpR family DNA-binding transcriptional regulator [Pantoea sp. M_5]